MKVASCICTQILIPFIPADFEEPSPEGSRQQIQMLVSLEEGACVQQPDLDLPAPLNLLTHGESATT